MNQLNGRPSTILFLCTLIAEAVLLSCKKTDPQRAPLRQTSVIDSISPKTGPLGTTVTIYGQNLGDNTSEAFVNGKKAEIKSSSQTKFIITVPDNAGTGPITIKTTYGQTKGPNFNYVFTDTWIVSTFAGSGEKNFADGLGVSAKFNDPQGITRDGAGNFYVSDAGNHRIRKITPAGMVSTFAGSGQPGPLNGTGTAAQFFNPLALVIDQQNNLYVVDSKNNKIRKITPGAVVTTFAGSGVAGSLDNTGALAQFNNPTGIAINLQNNTLYVVDGGNNKIRAISSAGVVTSLAGSGSPAFGDGTGIAAKFNSPAGLVVDLQGNLYVADYANHRIRKVTIPAGSVTSPLGIGTPQSTDGRGTAAGFNNPYGITIDGTGNLYVADWGNNRIRKILPDLDVKTFAGTGGPTPFAEGDAVTKATFNHPSSVVIDTEGNFYVTDSGNNRIRKITLFRH